MRFLHLIALGCLGWIMIGCEADTFSPDSAFLVIYDDQDYNAEYKPVALGQTDSSFLALSERKIDVSNFSGINLIISGQEGEFIEEVILDDQYVAPTKGLLKVGQDHYFFCMDRNTLRPQLVSVSPLGNLTYTPLNISTSYPLAANINSANQLILLSYNQEDKTSVISLVSTAGSIQNQIAYSIGAGNDVLQAIINHFTRENGQLPFYCGQAPDNSIYFNGFYNYTLSTVFTNFADEPAGVIQGQGVDAGMKYLLPTGGNSYAFIAYQFEDHFMNANIDLPTTGISSSVNYFTRKVPEIAFNSYAKIIPYTVDNEEVLIIAAETEGRQVVLYFFDNSSGQLINNYFIGTLNPFTFADIIVLEDGGLGILGTTFLADRFERVYLQKISKEKVKEII